MRLCECVCARLKHSNIMNKSICDKRLNIFFLSAGEFFTLNEMRKVFVSRLKKCLCVLCA